MTKIHPRDYESNRLIASVKQSRSNIYKHLAENQNRPLDVVLLHFPYCQRGQCSQDEEKYTWRHAWPTLESLKGAEPGKVHAIGVSNFDANQLRELLSITNHKVSVVQNWMDPFHQDVEVRQICKQNNIVYMGYSSFGTQWEWKIKHNPVFTNPLLQTIADKYALSIAEVVLSWVMREGAVAIPRASTEEHIMGNAQIISNTHGMPYALLDDEDILSIRRLDGILGSLWD